MPGPFDQNMGHTILCGRLGHKSAYFQGCSMCGAELMLAC